MKILVLLFLFLLPATAFAEMPHISESGSIVILGMIALSLLSMIIGCITAGIYLFQTMFGMKKGKKALSIVVVVCFLIIHFTTLTFSGNPYRHIFNYPTYALTDNWTFTIPLLVIDLATLVSVVRFLIVWVKERQK